MAARRTLLDTLLLLLLTLAAVFVHGYHLGIEDQAWYLPAIKKNLDPALYPHDASWFLAVTRWMLFDELVAFSIRAFHLPLGVGIFLWHLLSVFLLLLACLRVAQRCFAEPAARWAGVGLVAALLTLPVTGTLVLMADQYLHPRVPADAALLFALAALLDRRPLAPLWIVLAAAIHPLVAAFGMFHLAFQAFRPAWWRAPAGAALLLAPALVRQTSADAWREVMGTRRYYFALEWAWYEWLGALAPPVLLWMFARLGRRRAAATLAHVAGRLGISTALGVAGAVLITTLPGLERLVPTQPMRVLHFVYLLLFLLGGGLLGQGVLRDRPRRWALLFLPVCALMFYAQQRIFPASPHVEWPGAVPQNAWCQAFDWIREKTPRDALFALDPRYLELPGEDFHGFRALAERSTLTDYVKDPGVPAIFPSLAQTWLDHQRALAHWREFTAEDFRRLGEKNGVGWVVVEQPGVQGLPCPYENEAVRVCRIGQ